MMKKIGWMLGIAMLLFVCACSGNKESEAANSPQLVEKIDSSHVEAVELPVEDSSKTVENVEEMEKVQQDPAIKVLKCTFDEIEFGDYLHFGVRDLDGKQYSFYLAKGLPYSQWEQFELHPKKMKGTALEIEWRNVDKFLEHAGAVNNIDEITKITVLK